jgi:hypothetical protein
VIVPLLDLLRRQRIGLAVWGGAALAVGGLYLLSVAGGLRIGLGDGRVRATAFGWAVHVHMIGRPARRVRPLQVAAVQFAVCGALSLVVALFVEAVSLANLLRAGIPILCAGLLSTGVAYRLQVVGQRHVDPAWTGIILSLEAGGSLRVADPRVEDCQEQVGDHVSDDEEDAVEQQRRGQHVLILALQGVEENTSECWQTEDHRRDDGPGE